MPNRTYDPLLTIARIFIYLLLVVAALVGVVTLIATPAAFVFQADLIAAMAEEGFAADARVIPAIAGALALICLAAALSFYFLLLLLRIVGSVGEGDPFIPINAERLQKMGIIAIFIHIVGMVINLLGELVESSVEGTGIEWDIGVEGVLIGVLLLILARVFRKGTQMREELEGTV